ncbi:MULTISPECIES: hypothetical protein [unclassified Mesorhizobium]
MAARLVPSSAAGMKLTVQQAAQAAVATPAHFRVVFIETAFPDF